MRKVLVIFLSLICTYFTHKTANAEFVQGKQTFIEADYVKTGQNNSFFAKGHTIIRRPNLLMNANEVEAIKQVQKAKEEQEKNSNIVAIKDKNSNNDKYIFYVNDWVKLRTDDNNIIYAKSMFQDENKNIGWLNNAQIFPGGNRDHTEIYSTKIVKEDCIYTLEDASICPCKIFTDDNVEGNRKNPFFQMTEEDELLEKPKKENAIDNTNEEMHKSISNAGLSIKSDRIIYNGNENAITFEKMKWRMFGVPFFYIPKYTLHTDDAGDTGFLMPQMMISKSRQTGFEIPFYWKIKSNMDLLVSRSQYFDVGIFSFMTNVGGDVKNNLNSPDKRMQLKDLSRYRVSSTNFRFRHLISTDRAYESFYVLEGMLLDRSQLYDDATGMGATKNNDPNGEKIMGYRWMADLKAKMKLTNTTFLHINQYYASDKNIAYWYLHDPRQVFENKVHLFDVAERHYFSAEAYSFQSGLMKINDKITPPVIPVVRADYDFKKDKLGGNFYVKSKAYYLHREEGFRTATAGIDSGYRLPYYLKNGTKITADTMMRLQYNHIDFNNFSENPYLPYQYRRDNLTYFFGNLGGLMQSGYYVSSNFLSNYNGGYNKFSVLNFNKIQTEHPIMIKSVLGKTIINPKVAVRYSPNSGKNLYIPVEDNLNMNMNSYNAFELLQSSGYGVYDTGGSVVYGANLTHRFKKGIEVDGGIAQNVRMGKTIDEEILAESTGFRRSMSDLMANFGFKFFGFSGQGYLNYDATTSELRMFLTRVSYGMRYFYISVGYSSFSKNATIFGAPLTMINTTISIEPIRKLKISVSADYNLNGVEAPSKYIGPGFSFYSISAQYTISCITIGFRVMENKIRLNNMPSNIIYRFMLTFNGFG